MASTLREEILGIEGIDGAEFDGDADVPEGVRVRLGAGADADLVSREVRRVLAERGMRSHLTGPRVEPAQPPPPPGAPGGAVVALPGRGEARLGPAPPAPVSSTEPAEALPEARSDLAPALESVAVEESRGGVTVRLTATDGRTAVQRAQPLSNGVDAAVVAAVVELTGRGPIRLLGVQESVLEGSVVLTVVVEREDRSRRAGSAVSEGGRAYGIARAAWRALTATD
ncbi:MAG: hypothetical protein ACE5GC_05865 [Acidimicrobiia bacterium]